MRTISMDGDAKAQRQPDASALELVRPLVDALDYRLLTLPNGLQALLIHDSETDKAAAAVDVSGTLCNRLNLHCEVLFSSVHGACQVA